MSKAVDVVIGKRGLRIVKGGKYPVPTYIPFSGILKLHPIEHDTSTSMETLKIEYINNKVLEEYIFEGVEWKLAPLRNAILEPYMMEQNRIMGIE
jgi:hypothetical protein